MEVLNRIIHQMNKEEVRFFKIYSTRMINTPGRKDLQLFDKIRVKKERFNEEAAARKLYGAKMGSYYRLKHRLLANLNEYIVLHHYGKDKIHDLNRDWALYNVYAGKNNFELAFHFLKKAEKQALAFENFEMLDIIYNGFIKLSAELVDINPEDYIEKRKENAARFNLIREMDQALAVISYRLRSTQNFSPENITLTSLLNSALQDFVTDATTKKSRSFQTRIYRAISQILLQRHQYAELSKYVLKTYKKFEREKWFDKDSHDIKLQMLTYLSNSFYRLGNNADSLLYAQLLGEEIKAYGGFQYKKFVFFYYNALILNYMRTDIQRAITIMDSMENEMKQRKINYYDQFIYVNKAIAYHWLNKPDLAIRTLVKLYVLDSFKAAGDALRFQIITAELIMQFDARDPVSFNQRLNFVRKEYRKLLRLKEYNREKTLFVLMDTMMNKPDYKKNKPFLKKVGTFINTKEITEDNESALINYGEWVKRKLA